MDISDFLTFPGLVQVLNGSLSVGRSAWIGILEASRHHSNEGMVNSREVRFRPAKSILPGQIQPYSAPSKVPDSRAILT